ncbi:hypothetical protein DICVIV_07267 [Dictyocaulus viviparus]|uniref:Uncharacterized protein n=1 Tax=Dictyocaulus viviparus TaxID=29172 RepID=A0A0D8XSB7_DICVI|nr:hypothetical protein DICVIV_07267 [Dictyocaulus viviparus]
MESDILSFDEDQKSMRSVLRSTSMISSDFLLRREISEDCDKEECEEYAQQCEFSAICDEETLFPHEGDSELYNRFALNYRKAWTYYEEPCDNYYAITGELVASVSKKGTVEIPEDVASLIHHMHRPTLERTDKVVNLLFAGSRKRYVFGSFFKMQDRWTVFWHPRRLCKLSSSVIQAFVCAALNSRRQLHFVIGAANDSKIIGCKLSDEERKTMRRQFNYSISMGFVPPLNEGLVRLSFHQVCDKFGFMIPDLYIALISINDKVDKVVSALYFLRLLTIYVSFIQLYQLPSGRVFYVNYDFGIEKLSFSSAHKLLLSQRSAESDRISNSKAGCIWNMLCLRGSDLPRASLSKQLFQFGIPGFIIGFLAYDFLPNVKWK